MKLTLQELDKVIKHQIKYEERQRENTTELTHKLKHTYAISVLLDTFGIIINLETLLDKERT